MPRTDLFLDPCALKRKATAMICLPNQDSGAVSAGNLNLLIALPSTRWASDNGARPTNRVPQAFDIAGLALPRLPPQRPAAGRRGAQFRRSECLALRDDQLMRTRQISRERIIKAHRH
jgi:hypothetical protein